MATVADVANLDLPPVENMGLIKQLAHNEKVIRDRAMTALSTFLRSKCSDDYEEDGDLLLDFLKLWKGLFYGMWMSDKLPVQLELAQSMAELIHCFPEHRLFLAWVRSIFLTFQREWYRIDKYRLDKYYALIRKNLHECFVYLAQCVWEEDVVSDFVDIVKKDVIMQRKSTGLRLHASEVYLIQLCQAAGQTVTTDAFQRLLTPFYECITSSGEEVLLRRVRESIFDQIAEHVSFKDALIESEEGDKDKEESKDEENATTLRLDAVPLSLVADEVWRLASSTDSNCRPNNRKELYNYHKVLKKRMKRSGLAYQVTMPIQVDAQNAGLAKQWEEHSRKVLSSEAQPPMLDVSMLSKKKENKKNRKEKRSNRSNDEEERKFGEDVQALILPDEEEHDTMPDWSRVDKKLGFTIDNRTDDRDHANTTGKKKDKKRKKKAPALVGPRKKGKLGGGTKDSLAEEDAGTNNGTSGRTGRSPTRRVQFAAKNESKKYKASIRDLKSKGRLRGSSAERVAKRGGVLKPKSVHA